MEPTRVRPKALITEGESRSQEAQDGPGSPPTLFDALAVASRRFRTKEFLVVGNRQEVITFGQLEQAAQRCGRALHQLGIGPGDRVAVAMPNSVNWAVAAFGAARVGAVLVPLSTRLVEREVTHCLRLTRTKVLLLHDEVRGRNLVRAWLPQVRAGLAEAGVEHPDIVVSSDSDSTYVGTITWADFLQSPSPDVLPDAKALVDRIGHPATDIFPDAAAIMFTSGTTASPKGAVLGHTALLRLALEVGRRQQISEVDRFYSIAPFFHCSGFMHAILVCLRRGATLFTSAKYQSDEAATVIRAEGVTVSHGAALPLEEMSTGEGLNTREPLSLERVWTGGGTSFLKRLEQASGVLVCGLYGLTETGGNATATSKAESTDVRHGTSGRPLDGIEVQIVDPASGREVPAGADGEILVRGWNLMLGYFEDPQATASAIDVDGWLHTGDLGHLTQTGHLTWICRIKDVIRVGGENVAAAEVESLLLEMPDIEEAAVVAMADARLGEVPIAFVVMRKGVALDEMACRDRCRQALASFKIPRQVIALPELPRTDATNRVQKARLRNLTKGLGGTRA